MKFSFTILSLFFIVAIYGQTGPGGVGTIDGTSSLKIWLRADDLDADNDITDNPADGTSVSTWSDYSGNGNNFTQSGANRPTYSIGTFKAVNFDASAATVQYMNATSTGSYSNSSAFFVSNPVNVSNSHTLFNGSSTSLRMEQWNNTNRVGFTRYGVADYSSSLSTPFGSNSIIQFHKSSGSSTLNVRRNNGNNNVNIGSTTAGIPYDAIGRNTAGTDDATGDFFEVILFNSRVNNAQRIIIQNYLSAKYGNISISQNYYNEDNAANGDFDYKVAGIGRTNASNIHSDSQGTGIIRINNPSSLGNNDFLFWGEDVEDADYTFSESASNNYISRIDTKWRVSERNNVGTVTVSVNASDINFNDTDGCNQLQLVVDNNSDFSSPTSTYTFTLGSGVYTATGVNFTNNDYFTLQYTDVIVLDGSTAYNGSGTANKPNTSDDCYKLFVKSNTLTLSEDADVREVEIESGAILAVDSGYRLKAINGINNSGEIRLVGSSQLVQTHTGTDLNTGTGNLFVDQTASTSSVYHSGYWTSPVNEGSGVFTISGVLKDGTVPTAATSTVGEAVNINFISGFDGDASASPIEISTRWLAKLVDASDWTRLIGSGASLNIGEGWNMKSMGATFTFKGRPNDGTYTIPISQDNFSLVGNPYPSALDSETFISDNTSAITGTLYLYNSSSDNTHIRNAYTGTYSTIVSGVTIGGGRYLPIGQAFFVTRTAAGSGTITFQNSQRSIFTLSDTAPIVAKSAIKKKGIKSKFVTNHKGFPILRLGFNIKTDDNYNYNRQIAAAFRKGKTSGYENGYDGKMFDKKPSDFAFKVEGEEKPFVISTMQEFDENIKIPLILEVDKNREVTFKIDLLENFDDVTIYLNDKLTGEKYDLRKSDIKINVIQGNYPNRFFVSFKYEFLEDDGFDFVKMYHSKKENSIILRKSKPIEIKELSIYNINGSEVFKMHNSSSSNKIEFKLLKEFSAGVYFVKIESDKGVITQKIGI